MSRRGVYPGSFNPLTVAHLAIAEAARKQRRLDRLDLVLSRSPLAKAAVDEAALADRVAGLERAAATRSWLGVVVTDAQLLADIAEGYDVLVLGADKWAQLHDTAFYGGSAVTRDRALARLPELAIAPRGVVEVPADARLTLPAHYAEVSSTAVRAGQRHWLAPELEDPGPED
ncbi:MAG: hypothetical protein AVDCRST_MAG50-834 [uncultured Acidimicrobiales bacterium]|uniref:Cytidyltransferase-like domain-containing protein n=1 Tax=uncultured Acidimicrobiales bacterium TaxID=310071 RepID=A0A6J4HJA3_9ACTN|nr:MAG: hypothetical protein AVDCRST_MAG50-834 [uncultured Acidimicrobiales bacterium]